MNAAMSIGLKLLREAQAMAAGRAAAERESAVRHAPPARDLDEVRADRPSRGHGRGSAVFPLPGGAERD